MKNKDNDVQLRMSNLDNQPAIIAMDKSQVICRELDLVSANHNG